MKTKGLIKSFILFWGLEFLFFKFFDWYRLSPSIQVSIILTSLIIGVSIVLISAGKKRA